MSTIVTIQSTDVISSSRTDLNTNFSNLNADKIETSYLDTDTALTANSDVKIATQKAVKAYVDSGGNQNASLTARGISEEATAAEIDASTQTGGTGAELFVNPKYLNDCHNIPTVAPSTSGNFMRSNGTDWISEAVSVPFGQQEIALKTGTTVFTQVSTTTNSDRTVLFVGIYTSSNIYLYRYAKDSVTGTYFLTHYDINIGLSGGGQQLGGMCVVGSYLYVNYLNNAVNTMKRYDVADLTNATAITFSGTSANSNATFTDGTDIFIYGTGNGGFYRYTISGTTITNAETRTFTSAGAPPLSSTCDGTNVWAIEDNGSSNYTIRKYTTSGGAAVSSATFSFRYDAYYNGVFKGLFMAKSDVLGLGYIHTETNETAITGTILNIVGKST